MSAQQQPWSGIQIETSFFPLSFFLYMCTPTIVIDGVPQRRPWGTHSIPLTPGMHNIQVSFHYLFMSRCGFSQMNVVVQPNCVHRIKRSEEHTSELQSPCNLVCRLLLEKKKKKK